MPLTDLIRRLRRLDRRPPVVLPSPVDRASEWWARRGPRSRTAVVVLMVVVTAVGLTTTSGEPVAEQDVWVATDRVEVGQPIADAALRRARRPATTLPPGALDAAASPDGVVTTPLLTGQVLTSEHLVADLTGLLGPDEVAVAVQADQLAGVPTGVAVDVLAVAIDGTGRRLAGAARVLAADVGWLWLGVPVDVAADVAAADADGRLSLARRPVRASSGGPPPPRPDASP